MRSDALFLHVLYTCGGFNNFKSSAIPQTEGINGTPDTQGYFSCLKAFRSQLSLCDGL